jgi:hypothetical protein
MAKKHNVPEKVGEVLREIGLTPNDAGWDCHGTFVLLHKALEKVAAHKNVRFDPPQIIEANGANKHATILVTGHLGDKTEWSLGEASPLNYKTGNNQAAYPWAMAEKRAKDRVILKLVGLHGDVYSEEEADEFKEAKPAGVSAQSAANINGPKAGGSNKLDEAFSGAPDLEGEVEAKIAADKTVEAILEQFPGAKVTQVRPNKESLGQWAAACKDALGSAQRAEHVHEVLKEIRNVSHKYADTAGVPKLTQKVYDTCYLPACERIGCTVDQFKPTQPAEVAL